MDSTPQKQRKWTCGVTLHQMLFGSGPISTLKAGGTSDHRRNAGKDNKGGNRNPNPSAATGKDTQGIVQQLSRFAGQIAGEIPSWKISLPEIKQHPWSTHDLPGGSQEYNAGADSVDVAKARTLQSMEEINRLAHQAATLLASGGLGAKRGC